VEEEQSKSNEKDNTMNDTIVNSHIQDPAENDIDSVGEKDGKVMEESKEDERDESI